MNFKEAVQILSDAAKKWSGELITGLPEGKQEHDTIMQALTFAESVDELFIELAPRYANAVEVKAICDAMTNHYGARFFCDAKQWDEAGNYDYFVTHTDIMVRESFISDGPGFAGAIAWVQFGGGPANCCILSKPDTVPTGRHGWTWDIVNLET